MKEQLNRDRLYFLDYPKGSRIPVPLKTSGTSGSRIVGGVLTTVEDHPYVVCFEFGQQTRVGL